MFKQFKEEIDFGDKKLTGIFEKKKSRIVRKNNN